MYIAIEAVSLGAITAVVLMFGIVVLMRRQHDLTSRIVFFFQALCGAVWTIASTVRLVTTDIDTSLIAAKIVYISAAAMMCVWCALAVSFSKLNKLTYVTLAISLTSLAVLTATVILPDGALIEAVAHPPSRTIIFGEAELAFPIYVTIISTFISAVLAINFATAKSRLERTRHLYVLCAAMFCIIVMGLSAVLLPHMGIFEFYWIAPFMLVALTLLMSVAMFRYRLFSLPSSKRNLLDDRLVVSVSLHAVSNTDPQHILDNTVADLIKVDRISTASIIIFTNNRQVFAGDTKQALTLDEVTTIANSSLLQNKAIAIEELTNSSKEHQLFDSHDISALAIIGQPSAPIFGAIIIGNSSPIIYSEQEMDALSSIANIVNIAFQSSIYIHKNQELQQLDAAKDELLSIASHNLRTPLTVVRGYVELVIGDKTDIPSPKHLGYLTSAENEIIKMARIIDDFLTLSRIQIKRFVLNKTPVDLRQIVLDEISTMQPLATHQDRVLKSDIANGNYAFELDDSKIRQVITNLIDNAIFYSGKSPEITVRLYDKNNQAIFEVEDHGIGVPEEDRDKLWQKFSRASNAQDWRSDGTGTGLYMVRRIVEDHGGTVIYRPLKQGSIFGFSMPQPILEKPTRKKPSSS
jgi:signal transduction histidine kinase